MCEDAIRHYRTPQRYFHLYIAAVRSTPRFTASRCRNAPTRDEDSRVVRSHRKCARLYGACASPFAARAQQTATPTAAPLSRGDELAPSHWPSPSSGPAAFGFQLRRSKQEFATSDMGRKWSVFCAAAIPSHPMSARGQNTNLPRRSIAVRFTLNKQTLTGGV